jgi:FkbM family methyltransferase
MLHHNKKKIFLDGGGHNGCSVKKYLNKYNPDEIYSFEPNPVFKKSNPYLIQKAIWIYDGQVKLYLDSKHRLESSSIIKNKKHISDKYMIVDCIDFSKWIINKFNTKQHEIDLKLDIEGAEYEVLNKMIKDGSIKLINKLFIEFHYDRINFPIKAHNELLNTLRQNIKNIEDWDALCIEPT